MEFLVEPLEYEFFRHGLLAALMVGSLCGLIGMYVVLRGMSYVGHGLSHAAFGGAVVGFTLNLDFYLGAGAMGLLAALLINRITKNGEIKLDAAIGIVTTAMFALGVAIISQVRTFSQNFEAALFGNILGITNEDLLIIGLVTACASSRYYFCTGRCFFPPLIMKRREYSASGRKSSSSHSLSSSRSPLLHP